MKSLTYALRRANGEIVAAIIAHEVSLRDDGMWTFLRDGMASGYAYPDADLHVWLREGGEWKAVGDPGADSATEKESIEIQPQLDIGAGKTSALFATVAEGRETVSGDAPERREIGRGSSHGTKWHPCVDCQKRTSLACDLCSRPVCPTHAVYIRASRFCGRCVRASESSAEEA